MSDWKESALHHKYAELPEEPRYKKKKKKKSSIQRSDHKHRYADMLLDCNHYIYYRGIREPRYYIRTYCTICGRVSDININDNIKNPTLPIIKVEFEDLFAKRINLEDVSVC